MKSGKKFAPNEIYALVFGLFLGLCILKFGNPVILDQKIYPPTNLSEYWSEAWPIHWANWILLPLAAIGAILIILSGTPPPWRGQTPQRARYMKWLSILPLLWLGWEFVSATQTVDASLTAATLWQFAGCAACYFIGIFLFRSPRALNLLLIGILAAFTICLIRAVQQHFEFPQDQKFLLEGQSTGWTNMPPAMVLELKRDQTIITTNGLDVVSPMILAKFAKGRVMGTLVYPNALAGIILLLFPVSIILAVNATKNLRPIIRTAAIGLTVILCAAAFFWSGSKFGWLIAMFIGGLCLFRLRLALTLKIFVLALAVILGLGLFAIRFHTYFEKGATSTTARFDYWRAAVRTTRSHSLFGTGPGTFQRPYAQLKSPDAEMARLTHNDYLEQFSDSGVVGGIIYATWIIGALIFIGRDVWKSQNRTNFAIFLGMLGWFIQGMGEFSLFIPALAWSSFTFLGSALTWSKAKENPPPPEIRKSVRQKPAPR